MLRLILACFLLVGCTTVQFSNYDQSLKVTTAQPGAEIRFRGKLLGVTPSYVRIRRGRKPHIELRYPGQPALDYQIETRYRWADSFFPGIFGITFAPIFIGLDLSNGTAWRLENVEDLSLPGRAPDLAGSKKKTVAIAPPQVSTSDDSDQVARSLQVQLAGKSNWTIYPFRETEGYFEDAHYTHDNVSAGGDRSNLFYDLKATHILESKPVKGEKNLLEYSLRNVFTDEIEESGTLALPERRRDIWGRTRAFLVGVIPNSLTVDLASRATELEFDDGTKTSSTSVPAAGWLSDVSKFAGSLGFTNLIPPGRRANFEGHVRSVSTADFNFSRFKFGNADISYPDTKYQLTRGVIAAGPQFYLETVLGVFYLDIMWGGGYSRVQWDGQFAGSNQTISFQSIVGFGFYRYFSNRVAMRLFVKRVSEDKRIWNESLDKSQNADVRLSDISVIEAGLSLVFYLPEAKRKLRDSQKL